MTQSTRSYRDLHEHLQVLQKRGLLRTIDRPIDKDAELHPLVRWQFVGGMDEDERKAFLFTNIVDGRGRKYDMPVVVGAIAANPAIYCDRHGRARSRTSRRNGTTRSPIRSSRGSSTRRSATRW